MKLDVEELSGSSLDWAIAKAEGFSVEIYRVNGQIAVGTMKKCIAFKDGAKNEEFMPFTPSLDWRIAGPIMERDKIVSDYEDGVWCCAVKSSDEELDGLAIGSTHLEAGMRAFVSSKLGRIIDIPDQLLISPNKRNSL